jgi:hypothetical protein
MKPILAILTILLAISACRKPERPTLNILTRHHTRYIPGCTVYIEYNTLDKPSDDVYDDSAVCVMIGGKPTATFYDLQPGNYYLFGKGFDEEIGKTVKGGNKYIITKEGTLEYTLDITED